MVVRSESTCLKPQLVEKKIKKRFGFNVLVLSQRQNRVHSRALNLAEDGLTSGRLKPNTFKWWIRWVFNKRSKHYYWPEPVTRGSDVFMAAFLEDRPQSNELPVPVPQHFHQRGGQTTWCVLTFTMYTLGTHQAVDASLTLLRSVGKWQSCFFFHYETKWKKNPDP